MRTTWISLLLTLHLSFTAAIRVYTGTALGRADQLQQDSKLSKRSWSQPNNQPGLYKVKLTQRGYIQFLRYLVDLPPLQQYTFCLWFISSNYTYNHPLFSYSKEEKESLVKVWLSPSDSSLKVVMQNEPVAKVPVSIREGRWYHVCQSWSGVTGEWVLFIDGKLKASEQVHRHIGTMLPGGGDIAVGQELTDFNKGLDDGIEGEIFGFNMVDEAVDLQDRASQTLTHYRPEIDTKTFLPKFKKLPAIRKSFEEIQSYISQLPTDMDSVTTAPAQHPVEHPEASQTRRTKSRVRSKLPIRKVVVYREERMDDGQATSNGDRPVELLRTEMLLTKIGKSTPEESNAISDAPRLKINQVYDDNYNMHAYKGPKERPKSTGYKIYEDENNEDSFQEVDDQETNQPNRRRARQNIDVYSLWEANRNNPFYVKPYEPYRSKFHFEIEQKASRRSLNLEPQEEISDQNKAGPRTRSNLPEAIPVFEDVDEGFRRKRRDASNDTKRESRHIHTGTEFRPLPMLSESFVNLLTPAGNKETMQKISLYIRNSTSVEPTPAAVTFVGNEALQRRDPQYFPNLLNEEEVAEASQTLTDGQPLQGLPKLRQPNMVSAGSDLVSRSYIQCALSRGSPVTDKRHVLISWSDTPVRIYGGAMVANAHNICGHF